MSDADSALVGVLASVAQTLDSGEDRPGRVRQVLRQLRRLVPYERCAVLSTPPGAEPELFVQPEPSPEARAALQRRLAMLLDLVSEQGEPRAEDPEAPRPAATASHLSVPLIRLDEVVGLLFVEYPDAETSGHQALPILAVVASQLANYLTLVHLLAEQKRVNQELQRTSAFQQMLVGIVGHDLRNPLSAISMAASVLLRKTEDPRSATTLGRIISSSHRAARITNNLLDLTRERLGTGIPIFREPTPVRELVEEAIEELRLAQPGRAIELHAAPPESLWAEVDGDRLAQVIGNLLTNAATYSPPDTPVRVNLAGAGARELVLEVHNEGPAIPSDVLHHLFDPFKRGTTYTDRKGLGLGLYIAHTLVRAHEGRIEVRSAEHEGTTFRVTLPRRAAAPPERPATRAEDPR